MNKKLFLLPFLVASMLLAGCNKKPADPTPVDPDPVDPTPTEKQIWEEDEVEGESTIAQVKAGEAGQYYTVRGTVVANSGSTLAIYRKGQFLYCYNFNNDTANNGGHDKIEEHKLGSFVEIHAQSSTYSNSVQLTAYDVGNKNDKKYDQDAYLKVLAEKGETVAPVAVSAEADLKNEAAAGMLMKVSFVPDADLTLDAASSANQDLAGHVGETAITTRMEKYLPEAVKTDLLGKNPTQFEMGATYEIVGLGAAQSEGHVRVLLVEGSSWKKTAEAQFADPTEVIVAVKDGDAAEIEVDASVQLEFVINPATAKQKVVWSSADETIATVDENGKVKGVAPGKVNIKAAAADKVEVFAEIEITVKAAAINYVSAGALSFNKNANVVITNELEDATDPKITYAENGVTIVVRKNTSSSAVNVWKSDYASCRWYVGHSVKISSETAFRKVVLSCDSTYATFKDGATGSEIAGAPGATVSYDGLNVILEYAEAKTEIEIVPDKQLRPNNVEIFKVA